MHYGVTVIKKWLPGIASCLIVPALLLIADPHSSRAQDNETSAVRLTRGIELRGISGYAAYYSRGLENSGIQARGDLQGDVAGGASADIAWTKYGERSNVLFSYAPSYTGRARYSSLSSLNHFMTLTANRKITPRLNTTFSLGADLSTIDQFLFSPTVLGTVASLDATFNELSSAFLSGTAATNPELSSALNAAPLMESPARNLLYGERVFTSGGQAAMSYSWSPRLSVSVNVSGRRTQGLRQSRGTSDESVYLVPTTTSGAAGMSVSYSLSPVSQVGGALTTSRVSSVFNDIYTTTAAGTVGRRFAQRWFLQVNAGMAIANPVRQTNTLPISTKPRPVAGGSLGFKALQHTILGSYTRAANDSYGLGASTSSSTNLAWRWAKSGSPWSLENGFSWEQLRGSSLADTSSWRASTDVGRKMSAGLTLGMQYAYINYSGRLNRNVYDRSQSVVRVSLTWSPQSR